MEAADGATPPPHVLRPQCIYTSVDFDYDTLHCEEVVDVMEETLRRVKLRLKLLIDEADYLHEKLVYWEDNQSEWLTSMLKYLLYTSKPFFIYLESIARNSVPQYTPPPFYIHSRLLCFSQKLCARLEQLVLTYANYNLVSVVESDPDSVSPLYIGRCQVDRVRLAMFRYCKPAPFLAQADTGLYKRMRWNVERLRDDQQHQTNEQQNREQEFTDTEYYFLCYEEHDPQMPTESYGDSKMKIWYIGQWVQVHPDPNTDDICDWILCEAPLANYHKLFCVGSEEPSSRSATDYLLALLLSY